MSRDVSRWWLTMVSLAFVACAAASAQQPTTQRFELTLKTSIQAMPFKIPGLENLPNVPGMPAFGAPQRTIDGEAVYAEQAVEPIYVTVPTDLKFRQNRLILTVPRPTPVTPATPGTPAGTATGKAKMTSKLYWHPDTAEGPLSQTVELDLSQTGPGPQGMPAIDMSGVMADIAKTASGSESEIPEPAVGQGDYVLNTGGTAVLDGFLGPIKVTQPEALSEVELPAGIDVEWEPVDGARGYILHATAMSGQAQDMTTIQWVSTLNEPPERVRSDYTVGTTIQDDLDNGILLPGDTTSCRVPADVFPAEPSMFMLTVTAVGNDFYSNAGGIVVYGKIRSEWMGMKMAGMPAMGMMPGGEQEGEQ